MSERPTPETDALDCELHNPNVLQDRYSTMLDHSRKLERERDEARERERVAIKSWDEERQRAIRESDRVLEAIRERDEAREKYFALAASLEYIASAGLTARHYEDEAKKMLALVFEKEAAK